MRIQKSLKREKREKIFKKFCITLLKVIMIEELIKMYEKNKEAAIESGKQDLVEYYSQTIFNLKHRKLNQTQQVEAGKKNTQRLLQQRNTLSTFKPKGDTHFERLQHLANAVNKTNKNNT
jgi:hypothetical protein